MIQYKVEMDKEISEGWTIRDFVNEIDDLVYECMYGNSILRTPRDRVELRYMIDHFMPKHMFHDNKKYEKTVSILTVYYANKYGYEE